MMIDLKNSAEIKIMSEAGSIGAFALRKALNAVEVGISTLELDQIAEKTIREGGATPAFQRVEDYKHTICVSVNDEVVHGLPSTYKLKEGDVIGIDTGAYWKGFNSDVSETVMVGRQKDKAVEQFLKTGKQALEKAIKEARIGNRIGDISAAIQAVVENGGYSVVRELIGHGVGRALHEEPPVPGNGTFGTGAQIEEGLVLAIEVIYNLGKRGVYLDKDGWTVKTQDRNLSGLFEKTVAVTKSGPLVLTPI